LPVVLCDFLNKNPLHPMILILTCKTRLTTI
jgi:hypothetical protein